MSTHISTPKPDAAIRTACLVAGLDATGSTMLHNYSNAIYLLPAERAVGRVMIGPDAFARTQRTQAVCRWLADDQRFPATRPLADIEPIAVGPDCAVSFWVYYAPRSPTSPPTSAQLADLLRQLHQLPSPPVALPNWVALTSLNDTIAAPGLSTTLDDEERWWIRRRIHEIREALSGLDWPLGTGLIHGDAWAGNVLLHAGSPHTLLGDWDWVSIGPREVDLVPTWHAAVRYGRGASWTEAFTERYGYDLRDWNGYTTLMAMRDLVQLTGPLRRASDGPKYFAALRERLDGLRSRDTSAVWTAL